MTKIVFDESKITIGDLEDFEDAIGVPLFDALKSSKVRDDDGRLVRHDSGETCAEYGCTLDDDGVCSEAGRPFEEMNLTAKAMKGLVWIVTRQENPDFTLEDARNVRVTELEMADSEDESAPKDDSESTV